MYPEHAVDELRDPDVHDEARERERIAPVEAVHAFHQPKHAVECDPSRIEFRLRTRYLDRKANTLDEALAIIEEARKADLLPKIADN